MNIYDIPPHISGDTWDGIPSITFLRDGSARNLSAAYIHMQVRASIDSPVVLDLSTIDSSIIIQNLLTGTISIPPRIVDIPVGNYIYDLKLITSDGEEKTPLKGTWPIISHVTRWAIQ